MSLTVRGACSPTAVDNCTLAGFHSSTAVTLICADGSWTVGGRDTQCARLALQLAEDGILMCEQITDQAIAVALIHGETALNARSENTGRQDLSQQSDVLFVGRGQVNQACEVGHDGIKRGDVDEAELSKGALQDLNPSIFRGLVSGGRIDGLDDFVDLRRDKRV